MDRNTNRRYFLALNRINHIGPRTIFKLLDRWPQLEEMFRLPQAELEEAGLPPKLATSISQFNFKEIEDDLRWQEIESHHLLTWDDTNYPALLKEIHDPPPVLYAAGQLSSLKQPHLAIVGTRKPSIAGHETAWRFARELGANKITIVSGLALGIDAQAHKGCLESGGKTIAVMGSGLDHIYPRQHRSLAQEIIKNGLLISEFPLKTAPTAGHFPRRNRIISGLSLATLVIEAAIKSGSLITARMAVEQNRDVLAVPGSILNQQAKGCHYLLQQGARLVTSSQDVMDELGLETEQIRESDNNITLSLARGNKNLVKCIGFEITTIDQIVARSGLSVEQVACDLAALEIEGIVKAIPGGYMRCF